MQVTKLKSEAHSDEPKIRQRCSELNSHIIVCIYADEDSHTNQDEKPLHDII
jgi:hypothetical protein